MQRTQNAVAPTVPPATPSPWMDTPTAANYLSCAASTLKVWRSIGTGPRYHIVNQKLIRYHVNDLDAYMRRNASHTSLGGETGAR